MTTVTMVKTAILLLAVFTSVPLPASCQRVVFGTNVQQQSPQQVQIQVQTQTRTQFLPPRQTFHQFEAVPAQQAQFHPEQPPPLQEQELLPTPVQQFVRPSSNEVGPPQRRPVVVVVRSREGRNENGPPQQQPPPQPQRIMSDTCLACLCQASTSCNMTTRCISGDQYCGAFLISKPYWVDAKKPTLVGDNPERPDAFIDCAVDPICSAQTVRNYMQRFEKDCNQDGVIDCDDLARIHLMSAFDCANPKVPTTGFYQKFRTCWDRVLQLSQKK